MKAYGSRCGLATAGISIGSAAAVTGLTVLCRPPLTELTTLLGRGSWSALPLELLLSAGAATVAAVCGAWLTLVAVATAVELLTGLSVRWLDRVTPVVVRRLVAAACGAIVASGHVPSAVAAPEHGAVAPAASAPAGLHPLEGLPLPDRAVGGAASAAHPALPRAALHDQHTRERRGPACSAASYTVTPGDSLWSIASRGLPLAAPVPEVDATWRQIYRTNRAVIGSDPDLLVPGTALRLPGATSPRAPGPGHATHTFRKDER